MSTKRHPYDDGHGANAGLQPHEKAVISEPGTAGSAPAKPAQIKSFTGIASATFSKIVDGGYLPDSSLTTVLAAGRLPMLLSVRNDDRTVGVPFLRADVAQSADGADDGPHLPPRTQYGVSRSMNDAEFFAGCARWWRHSGKESALATGWIVIVLGGFTVGLLEVNRYSVHPQHPDRIEYHGRVAARVDDLIDRQIRLIGNPSAETADFARQVLAARTTTAGGGVIAPLDADTKQRIAAAHAESARATAQEGVR